ncbi:chromosome segregation protein SMC [Tepidiphilus margaritifer]|uniref:chromosome segregation protein SMC n=1 Tax=Tepidiphilus margaritifer TaxID=203471 RepID=UPI0012FC54D8|nr:chromosome segregation protein SMC [Tepidiphilus margaritifer]
MIPVSRNAKWYHARLEALIGLPSYAVRLIKIKLAGFKTFVEPTTLVLPGALVGIVGPNGCGKSNVIDAVRWVLGEMRASALRGEQMSDVIFNGSDTRKPLARASVELVFDNADGSVPGPWGRFAEISVKRVVVRGGESSYFLNGQRVRRRDVVDLFLGTGLGPRAYAIIEQGMISRIVEAKPEELRRFLEEAAGVTRYHERRKETEARLRDARAHLERLADLHAELAAQAETLATQAERARRYRELEKRLRLARQQSWALRRREAATTLAAGDERIAALEAELERQRQERTSLEAALESARAQAQAAAAALESAQQVYFEASARLERVIEARRHREETLAALAERLERIAEESQRWQEEGEQARLDLARWDELAELAQGRRETLQERGDSFDEVLEALGRALEDARHGAAIAERERNDAQRQIAVERARIAALERSLQANEARLERLAQESSSLEGGDEEALERERTRQDTLSGRVEELREALAAAQAKAQEAQVRLDAVRDEFRRLDAELGRLEARRRALAETQARCAGAAGQEYAALWPRLEVAAGWEAAAETVLGPWLGARLVPLPEAARQLEHAPHSGEACLWQDLPLADEPEGFGPVPQGAVLAVAAVSTSDPTLAGALQRLLAHTVFVETIDETNLAWAREHGLRLVDRRGWIADPHGARSLGADEQMLAGVLERARELGVLNAECAELERQRESAAEERSRRAAACDEAKAEHEALRRELQLAEKLQRDHALELARLETAFEHARRRRQAIDEERAALSRQAERERAELATLEERIAELLEREAALETSCLERQADLRRQHERLEEARTQRQALARELQEAEFSCRECALKREESERRARIAAESLERLERERIEHEAERERLAAAPLEEESLVREAREHAAGALAQARLRVDEHHQQLRTLEETRQRQEFALQPLRDELEQARLQRQEAAAALAHAEERLAELGADLAALEPQLDHLDAAKLTREIERLGRELAALGEVNLAALETLRQVEERKMALETQLNDLTTAIGTLEEAIRRIDRETRQALAATFDAVDAHFGRLFPRLFGGGQAKLVLTGEEILDAGVQIVAQPPGKKNASIHLLSGGEKALTAIALVFSFFALNPAPFCILDEVDAPLDDANTERYARLLREMSGTTQLLFISHNKITMAAAEQLIGVTMQEQGVSRIVAVDIDEALRLAETP